jgi:hypothetical protein
MTYALTTTVGAFYAAPHLGDVYRSTDTGRMWEPLRVDWHQGAANHDPYIHALVAVE